MPLTITVRDEDLNRYIKSMIPGMSDADIENFDPEKRAMLRQGFMELMADNYQDGKGVEGANDDLQWVRDQLAASFPPRKQRLGTIRDADVDVFIEHLVPGITAKEISQFKPENRALIRQGLMDIATDNYNNGLGVQGAIAELQMVREELAAAFQGETQRHIGYDQGGKNVNFPLIGLAAFTIMAVTTGLMASAKMKKLYDDFMDDLNTRFPAPEWTDDAPDPHDVIPFYNTETINKLVGMLHSLSSKVLSYIDGGEGTFSLDYLKDRVAEAIAKAI